MSKSSSVITGVTGLVYVSPSFTPVTTGAFPADGVGVDEASAIFNVPLTEEIACSDSPLLAAILVNLTVVLSPGRALQSFCDLTLNVTLNSKPFALVVTEFPSFSFITTNRPSDAFPCVSLYVTDSHPVPLCISFDVILSNTFVSYSIFP